MSEIRADKLHNVTGDNDSGIDLSTNDQVDIKIADSVKARVDSSGNLLVATTSVGMGSAGSGTSGINIRSNGAIEVARSENAPLFVNRTTDEGDIVQFRQDGTVVGRVGVIVTDRFYIGGGGGDGVAIDSNSLFPTNDGGANQDNVMDLGNSSARWDDVRATNGTIQTSDRNDKQDIEELSDAEKRVAVVAKGLMRKFRWKDKVAEKGDNARTHFGIIAQDLQDAFTAEGLDASKYAMFCSDTWTDDDGKEQTR